MFERKAMQNIWAKRLEKNPALGNLSMVKGAMNRLGMQGVVPAGEQVTMPRTGMMGGRKMAEEIARRAGAVPAMKKGGKVKKMAKGGSASSRGDGIARKGKTKGRMV